MHAARHCYHFNLWKTPLEWAPYYYRWNRQWFALTVWYLAFSWAVFLFISLVWIGSLSIFIPLHLFSVAFSLWCLVKVCIILPAMIVVKHFRLMMKTVKQWEDSNPPRWPTDGGDLPGPGGSGRPVRPPQTPSPLEGVAQRSLPDVADVPG